MIAALAKTLAQLFEPELRAVIWRVLLLTAASFAGLWVALGAVLFNISWVSIGWLDTIIGWLGGALGVVLTLILFPPIATLVASLFQDRIALLVERRHYPDLGPTAGVPLGQQMAAAVKLLVWTIAANLVALPLYLLLPVANLLIFFAINGFLLGREYFEAVALRRATPEQTAALRRQNRIRIWLAGVAIAVCFWLPAVNLIAPIIGTMIMVHRFEALRRART
ncbi:MAG: EI24 domain-containing protein [Alphaproteobacteria bacterium]|jgi:uncharacterized protein involved in cysteine biosynthesis|nr:EI24 domain-containing protein [Alphaproteobacteria bacterium]MDP6517496.1 EI24 domain-containing protein [Alphaproteobacteria bacterium]